MAGRPGPFSAPNARLRSSCDPLADPLQCMSTPPPSGVLAHIGGRPYAARLASCLRLASWLEGDPPKPCDRASQDTRSIKPAATKTRGPKMIGWRPLAGLRVVPAFLDQGAQSALLSALRAVLSAAPLYTPRMPKTGKPLSVRMTNCGPLGWVTDESGYRYQPRHPETGRPWPPIPSSIVAAWTALAAYAHPPESCLINYYGPAARMGLHQELSMRPLFLSRWATRASSGSAARNVRIRHTPSLCHRVTPLFLAARRGSRFMASSGSSQAPRPFCRRVAGSTSLCGVSTLADLTFLPALPRVLRRNVKSKATLESNSC